MTAPEVQDAVQRLLTKYSEYMPLELLLETNRLDYGDYQDWREGRLENLDAVLADGEQDICTWLDGANSWAVELGLAREPVVHHGWKDNAGTVLTASAHPKLNALLSARFRRSREHRQLDLFIDSAPTVATGELIDSLTAGDANRARGSLERLMRIAPDHRNRHHALTLIDALESTTPVGTSQGVRHLERMEREWVPAALELLGARRRDFLVPLWRDIGKALEPAEFDPDRPDRHASRAYREGLDWEGLKRSVLAVGDHAKEPVLLARLAEACWRLRDRAGAIASWFTLCHTAPDEFEQLIECSGFPDRVLKDMWRLVRDQDLEPEITPAWFPAWMLLKEPKLASILEPRRTNDIPSRAYDAVMALLAHPQPDERGMELRRAVQSVHPGLLAYFLAHFSA